MLTWWVSTFYQALMKTPGDPVAQYFTENCPRYIILVSVTWLQTWQSVALFLLLASHPGPARTSSYGAGAVFVLRNTNDGRWSCICVTSTWDIFIAMATQKRNQYIVPKEVQWECCNRGTFEVDLDKCKSFCTVEGSTMTFLKYRPHEGGPGGIKAILCIWEKMPHLGGSDAYGIWSGTVRNRPARPRKGQWRSATGH